MTPSKSCILFFKAVALTKGMWKSWMLLKTTYSKLRVHFWGKMTNNTTQERMMHLGPITKVKYELTTLGRKGSLIAGLQQSIMVHWRDWIYGYCCTRAPPPKTHTIAWTSPSYCKAYVTFNYIDHLLPFLFLPWLWVPSLVQDPHYELQMPSGHPNLVNRFPQN